MNHCTNVTSVAESLPEKPPIISVMFLEEHLILSGAVKKLSKKNKRGAKCTREARECGAAAGSHLEIIIVNDPFLLLQPLDKTRPTLGGRAECSVVSLPFLTIIRGQTECESGLSFTSASADLLCLKQQASSNVR